MTLTLMCRTATTFRADGSLDEAALHGFLQRLVDQRIGLYLCSGGSGESHVMTPEELRRVYRIGVACGRGKVPVYANPPEQFTAQATLEQSQLAIECGVEQVNVYGPAGLHGYVPSDEEFERYHDVLLPQIRHPVALAPNSILGYTPDPRIIAGLCNRYSHVEAVNLASQTSDYMIRVQRELTRDIRFYAPTAGSLNSLALGAHGLLGAEANILPATHRAYLDLCGQPPTPALGEVYAQLRCFTRFVAAWGSSPRWIKMAMRVMGLPGGAGLPRPPFLLPDEAALRGFAAGLAGLGIPEIDAQLSRSPYRP
jgi:4-hydroxy-tetrahydrodipicolinate synthase